MLCYQKKNEIDILKEVKQNKINSKVIILTAKSQIKDKLEGFNYEAVDYITKLFHLDKLITRIYVQLNVNDKLYDKETLDCRCLSLDARKFVFNCANNQKRIDIIGKKFLILEYFIQNNDHIINRKQLYNKI